MEDIQKLLSKHGIKFELSELKTLKMELLFKDKKLKEDQLAYQKFLQRKEKKKKAKEILGKIHKEKLRDDLNF